MGGRGSGNWYRSNTKPTEQNLLRFSMSCLRKKGVISQNQCMSGHFQWLLNDQLISSIGYKINITHSPASLRVRYINQNTAKSHDYKVFLTTTQPHYGGTRWWFYCPIKSCEKRVAVLYLSDILACRQCHGLAYQSQNEAIHDRFLHKAQALHQQLGGDGVIDDNHKPCKPKGMHWKTYHRKMEEMRWLYQYSLLYAMHLMI